MINLAHLTADQVATLRDLDSQYGRPAEIKLEFTTQAYGLVWVRWKNGVAEFDPGAAGGERNLFIKPDGTRLSWTLLPGAA